MTEQITIPRELLQQVLEVLEAADNRDGAYSYRCEIDALRTLLDAPSVKPVVGALQIQLFGGEWIDCSQDTFNYYRKMGRSARALYTAPQAQQQAPVQKTEALGAEFAKVLHDNLWGLYDDEPAPAQEPDRKPRKEIP